MIVYFAVTVLTGRYSAADVVYSCPQSPSLEHVNVIPDVCDIIIEEVTCTKGYSLKMCRMAVHGI
jgi:hypothetical protein